LSAWNYPITPDATIVIEATNTLANDGADPGSLDATTANIACLRIRGIAGETNDTTALTVTSSWTAFTGNNTAGNPTASNMGVRGEFIISTGTGAASDPTYVAADHASVYVAFKEKFTVRAWASGGALATARQSLAGCGTQTAGLSFGGFIAAVSAVTEEYDGAAWASGGALATARYNLAGCGTQTAGLSFGGFIAAVSAVTEEYDGAAWASGGALATARQSLAGCGTQTAGLSFGGTTGSNSAVTEEYGENSIYLFKVTSIKQAVNRASTY